MSDLDDQTISMPLADAARLVGFSVDHLRKEHKAHRLTLKRSGRKLVVLRSEIERWANDLPSAIPGRHS